MRTPPRIVVASLLLALCSPLLQAQISVPPGGAGPGSGRPQKLKTPIPSVASLTATSPFDAEGAVALTRETIFTFDAPLDPSTVTPAAISAVFGGLQLDGWLKLSANAEVVTLFYFDPLPASSVILVTVNGDLLRAATGLRVDADGDGFPGGVETFVFSTISLTALADTAVCGRIFASELAIDGSGMSVNVPLVNAKISVDGAADTLFTFTDANGDYRLEPCPAGKFFVEIDGTNATSPVPPPGSYYPTVGKPFDPTPQQEVNMPDIYLPLVPVGTLQPVSTTSDVTVGFAPSVLASYPEFTNCSITVPAGSLFANDGTPGQMVGIAPVPPDKLPGPLPDQLDMGLVITVQTDGASNFDVPAPVVFPNVPFPADGYLPQPGEQFALWSFNHDTGNWEIVGPATVSADGLTVASNPGVGIKAPGWHGISPCPNQGKAPPAGSPCNPNPSFQNCTGPLGLAALGCLGSIVPGGNAVSACSAAVATQNATNIALRQQLLAGTINQDQFAAGIAAAAAQGVAACLLGFAGECPPCKAFKTILCAIDLGNALVGCGFELADQGCFGVAPPSASEGDVGPIEEAAEKLAIQQMRLESIMAPSFDIFGDTLWFAGTETPGQGQVMQDWLAVWASFTDPITPDGGMISAAEQAALLALPYPEQISSADVQAFLDRWNLSIGYWTADIFEVADVPSGGDTDFIDLAVLAADSEAAIAALFANQSQGFTTLTSGIETYGVQGWNAVVDLVTEPSLNEYYRCLEEVNSLDPAAVQRDTAVGGAGGVRCCSKASAAGGTGYFNFCVLDPSTLLGGKIAFATQGVGTTTTMLPVILAPSTQPDTDGDLLADDFEFTVGTQPNLFDTDNDGIGDGAELQNGTNPLDGLVAATGIIASVATPGAAVCLDAFNDVAVVGSGNTVTVYNVFNGMDPLAIASVVPDTGAAVFDLALDADRIAVALGSNGLAIIDISEPSEAAVVHSIPQTALGGAANTVTIAGGVAFVGAGIRVAAVDLQTGAVFDQAIVGQGVVDVFAFGDVLLAIANNTLYSLPLFDGLLDVADSAPLPGGGRVFCDGTLVHVTNVDGYNTFSVDASAQLASVASASGSSGAWQYLVTNGAGLGLALISVDLSGGVDVFLYDTSDPSAQSVLAQFETPGSSSDISLYNGRAYVADGTAGLQVINYLAYDSAGFEPGLSLSTNAGSDVTEGELVHVPVTVNDDVQVRNVELWVEGQKVQTDGDAPYEFFVRASDLDADDLWTVFVRASDTGGNASVTSPIVLPFVPDLVPPTVTLDLPAPNSTAIQFLLDTIGFSFVFSEPLAESTLCDPAITVTSAGADLALGTTDDVLVAHACSLVAQNRRLIMTLPDVPTGSLRVRLDDLYLLDGAGNLLDGEPDGSAGGDHILDIMVLATPERCWDVPFSGLWSATRNWTGDTLPQSDERVAINVPAEVTVTHASASTSFISLDCQEDFVLSGGTLSPFYDATFAAGFLLGGGTLAGGTSYLGGIGSWTGGQITGTLVVDPEASLDITTAAGLSGVVENAGLVTIPAGAPAFFLNSTVVAARLRNLPGGVLDLENDLIYASTGATLVDNQGTLRVASGSGNLLLSAPLSNSGLVEVETGILSLTGLGGTDTGAFQLAAGTRLHMVGTTAVLEDGCTFVGPGTLALYGNPRVAGDVPVETLSLESGQLFTGIGAGARTLRVTGTGTWIDGVLNGSGDPTLRIDPGATFTLTGDTNKVFQSGTDIEVAGTLVVDQTGLLLGAAPSEFRNLAGGVVDWRSNGNFVNSSPIFNAGTWKRTTGTGTVQIEAPFNNSGLVEVETGILSLTGLGGTDTGAFQLAAGTRLHMAGTTAVLEDGCTVVGPGTLALYGNTRVAGDVPVETLSLESGQLLLGIGAGTRTLRVTGTGTWIDGVLNGSGEPTLRIDPGATFTLTGATNKVFQSGTDIEVAGTLVVDQTGLLLGAAPSEFRNLAGGVVDWRSNGNFVNSSPIFNAGTWKRTTGTGTVLVEPPFANTGTLRVETGAFQINGSTFTQTAGAIELAGGTLVVGGSGNLTLAGGLLTGAGSVSGSVVHSGSTVPGLAGPAQLSIAGNWTQGGSGTLAIELGGTTVGTQYDQLAVGAAAALAGTLSVTLINGFDPQLGDTFTVLTFASRVGDFATYTLPALGAGKKLQASFTATALVLTVVPDP